MYFFMFFNDIFDINIKNVNYFLLLIFVFKAYIICIYIILLLRIITMPIFYVFLVKN